jgi:hypothetical protein
MPDDPKHIGEALATRLSRLSELSHLDSVGTDAMHRVADELQRLIPNLFDSPALKIARAVVDRLITPGLVGEIAAITRKKAKQGELRRSAAEYFVGAIRREFAKAGIPWER